MSRSVVMALSAATLAMVVLTITWIVVAPDSEPAASAATERGRQKAHDFLGGDPDRDVRGGQEMKPRW